MSAGIQDFAQFLFESVGGTHLVQYGRFCGRVVGLRRAFQFERYENPDNLVVHGTRR